MWYYTNDCHDDKVRSVIAKLLSQGNTLQEDENFQEMCLLNAKKA